MKARVAITIGDFNGIGPEVILKSLAAGPIHASIQPLLIGSIEVFQLTARKLRFRRKLVGIPSPKSKVPAGTIGVINTYDATEKQMQIGRAAPDAGVCAGLAIERAMRLCLDNEADAMVTGPVSKEALHFAGYNFPGQTEMLAMLTRSERVTMMLLSGSFRVALATVHIPIRQVPQNLFPERLIDKLGTVADSLKRDFRIASPRIAVLGLNPHAGESGAIGTEEKEIIAPAIATAREKGIAAEGPFSADGFFATYDEHPYDAVLAMYHDQGLIPLKMRGFHNGVNYSAGLRIVRTSPDHGTAFDIAGKGVANPGSMTAAIRLAAVIANNRKKS